MPFFSGLQGDSGVRVTLLSFLVGVASRGGLLLFLPEFITAIIHKVSVSPHTTPHTTPHTALHSVLPQLAELTADKPRYFINSLTHRLKQRLLQTLLLLLPHLPPVSH